MSMHPEPAVPPSITRPAVPTGTARQAARSATVGAYTARLHTALADVAPLWRSLEADGVITAYQRLDWTQNIVAHLSVPMRSEPLFVEVLESRTGRTIMLAPFALVRHRGYREITWFDLGVCDYAAPLLAPDVEIPADAMQDIWAAIRRALPRADLVRINRIPDAFQGRVNPLAGLSQCRRMEMQASGVSIGGDPATLLARLCRPGVIKDLGKTRRRLDRLGTVAFVKADTPEMVDRIFDALVEQRRQRFAEIGRFNLLSRPEIEAFYRAGAHQGLVGGGVRLFGFSVDGEWIAATYTLVQGGTISGLLATMAGGPWRNTSPGLHAITECMRWACAEGIDYFDFTVGIMPYKEDLGVQTRDLAEIVEVSSLRGALVTQVLSRSQSAKTWLRSHPEWYGKAQSARRWLRKKVI